MPMDPPTGSRSEPENNPIATCASMLSLRHFSACRDFARRLPHSDSDSLARILAVANVLSAADLYCILQLRPADAANRDLVRRQYSKLALLLDPTSADKFPFSDEALARVQEAWHVLSHPERRALYDQEFQRFRTMTFWTACPYCWNLFEYEKRYENCPLQCQSCWKTFHGVAINPPEKVGDTVLEGEELRQYYSCQASVPLMYYEVKEKENDILGQQNTNFVYISDDEGFEGTKGAVGNEELQGNLKRRMRVKTVAKKGVGNRMRRCLDTNNDLDFDLDMDVDDGELEFTEGDGDVFVGVRFDK
ncbi:hypothetical protein VNO77_40157 [Canavalia gladiata]|uniref:J domain-containing protein n=1 Tax=Canavalia gladiata TaxID=3824 RepID=A0AAN9JZN7_CANGL